MYSRSNSQTLSIPTNNVHGEHFPYRAMARNTEPEIFTFERIPAQRSAPVRRKKNQRVMYPAKVRKYLPPPEKNPAMRWLLVLILVLVWQIYTEEPCVESTGTECEIPCQEELTQYQVLPFRSAEEQVRDLTGGDTESHELSVNCERVAEEPRCNLQLNVSCPDGPDMEAEMSRMHGQSRRNGYVMALLYPAVYHRLGGDS